MSLNRIVVAALLAAACIGGALACGPFFPWQLLDNRDQTVADPVGLGFAFEASRLATAPNDHLRAVEPIDRTSPNADTAEPEAVVAEREEALSGAWRGLMREPIGDSDALVAKLAAAREAADGEAAMTAGAGLPIAVVNYIAGAIEFRADRFDTAMRYFEAIDRLPQDQRQIRAVAAAYMQGRTNQRLGAMAPARAAFQAARRYAEAGAPDPMGLAVASLAEEARIDLIEAGLVTAPWPVPKSNADDAEAARLIADAVRLYAEQAARGSKMALLSLREVATQLASPDGWLELVVADPLVRRLLVAYVVARDGQSPFDDSVAGAQDPVVVRVSEAVLAEPAPVAGDDLDRLAALAYQAGRYDLAEKLTVATNRPLGLWVRAKLALRRGDRAAAVKDWTAALLGTENAGAGTALDTPEKSRLRGELAIIRLSRGEYQDSLRVLFPLARTYWGDVAYIAERVLTVDELKAFVDRLPAAPEILPPPSDLEMAVAADPVAALRTLLARRLIREGRIREALAYFPAAAPAPAPSSGSTSDQRDDRATADAYLAAVEAARPGWPFDWPWQRVPRAEALFKVATLARQQGMELMGTEGPPDEAVLDGAFSGGFGQSSPNGMSNTPSALLGPDEASRFAASAPKPDTRFHYRVIATDRALAAADLLPQRSQAYAATLCWAARYAFDSSDEARAAAIYRRYVSTGAFQPWAKRFGRACPEPDFEAARTFWLRRIAAWPAQVADSVWRHITLVAAMAIVAAALLAAWARARRSLRARRG
jgi:tetratricopeptide (TPR) repeat protein